MVGVTVGQVILGVRDLDAATRRFEALGLCVVDGGIHPGLGTANRVVPLGESYLELLGVIDREEAAAGAYGRSLLERTAGGDCLVRWSIRTAAIEPVGARLGLTPEHRRRLRPDGTMLTWRAAGLELSLRDPWLPFFMQWDDPSQFPGAIPVEHPIGPCALSWLRVSTPDPDRLTRWTEGEADLPVIRGNGRPGIDAVAISTASGDIIIN
jgi:Glyoxalase-like domain